MDCFISKGFGGEMKLSYFTSLSHFNRGKRRKGKRKCLEYDFWTWPCLIIPAEVSAPASQLNLNMHPGPGQADGSRIHLFKWRPGRDGIKSRAEWITGQRRIFYCKSPLIKRGVICCFLITLCVLIEHHAPVKWSCPTLLHERWKDVVQM